MPGRVRPARPLRCSEHALEIHATCSMQVPDIASYDFCHTNKNTSFEQVSHNLKKSTHVWFTLTSPGKYGTLPSTGLQLFPLSYKTSEAACVINQSLSHHRYSCPSQIKTVFEIFRSPSIPPCDNLDYFYHTNRVSDTGTYLQHHRRANAACQLLPMTDEF